MGAVISNYHVHRSEDIAFNVDKVNGLAHISGKGTPSLVMEPHVIEGPKDIQAEMAVMFKNYKLRQDIDKAQHDMPAEIVFEKKISSHSKGLEI